MEVRQAAAVNFKIFVKPRWVRTCSVSAVPLWSMGFVKVTSYPMQAPQSDFDGVPLPDADKVCACVCSLQPSL